MTSLPSFPSSPRSRRFAALVTLAATTADLGRRRLDGARADLERLERQRRELGEHARRYERDALERAGDRGIDPRSFAHRREFVACLVARVDALAVEIGRCETRVRDAAGRHAAALAKEQALEALRRRRADEEALAAAREEQRRSDEAWRPRPRSTDRRLA